MRRDPVDKSNTAEVIHAESPPTRALHRPPLQEDLCAESPPRKTYRDIPIPSLVVDGSGSVDNSGATETCGEVIHARSSSACAPRSQGPCRGSVVRAAPQMPLPAAKAGSALPETPTLAEVAR